MGPFGGRRRHRRRRRGAAGRHHGARPRRLGHRRRREFRHRRSRHAERREGPSRRRPRAAAEGRDQGFAGPGVSRIGCATTPRTRDTATATSCACSPTRTCRPSTSWSKTASQFTRTADRPGSAPRRCRAPSSPSNGRSRAKSDRPGRRPQRFRAGAAARNARAAEGRRNPSASRDEEHHPRAGGRPARCSGITVEPVTAATLNIEARKGVVIATGGHTGNVNFRRMFDPRLTEEYQQACMP